MECLWFLLIGLAVGCAAGWAAGKANNASRLGIVGDLIAGTIGAVVGGPIFLLLALNSSGLVESLYISAIGAIVALCLLHFIKNVWKRLFGIADPKGGDCAIAPDARRPRRWYQFSLRTLLLLFIPAALMIALAVRVFRPYPVNVLMGIDQYSLCRYDDHAGHLPLAAIVQITNLSDTTVWYCDNTYVACEFVDGKWNSCSYATHISGQSRYQWTSLRSGETTRIVFGPVSEKATEIKIALPFTADWYPTRVHWVWCPAAKIVKKGQYYFPEFKDGAKQEEQVLPLPLP